MPITPTCRTCAESFANVVALQNHSFAKGHPCFACRPCDRAFASSTALEQHMASPRHDHEESIYPAHLDGRDESNGALDDGASNGETSDDPFCASCNREYCSMESLNQHLLSSPLHNWCFTCSRDFSTVTALAQHEASIAHKRRDFKCPFCLACFKSPSGIAHHIESGCHKFTRHHVTAAVQGMDIVPNISIKRITGPPSLPTQSRFIATEESFDGKSYKCYLCNKSCKTLLSLNVHLNSAAHDDDEFSCPKCKREFKVVSGFVQHLESRSCGLAKTTQIEGFFNDLSDQFSRLLKL